jgi:hypothetical protein
MVALDFCLHIRPCGGDTMFSFVLSTVATSTNNGAHSRPVQRLAAVSQLLQTALWRIQYGKYDDF